MPADEENVKRTKKSKVVILDLNNHIRIIEEYHRSKPSCPEKLIIVSAHFILEADHGTRGRHSRIPRRYGRRRHGRSENPQRWRRRVFEYPQMS